MKNYLLLAAMAAIVVPGAAVAQQHHRGHRVEVRRDRREVRQDRRELRQDRRRIHRDMRHNHVAYAAPYRNWSYRPVTVGYRLQPNFYGSRYYINDYNRYRLRPPSRFQRWIRYGDDLLLVNTRNGRVLRVVHYRGW